MCVFDTQVWELVEATSRNPISARVIYHEDGYSEMVDLAGDNSPAYVRLRKGLAKPSVLLQAKDHASYWQGVSARGTAIASRRVRLSSSSEVEARKPLLVLADAKQAKLFDTDVMQNSGGSSTVIASSWAGESAGDLLLQMDGRRIRHAYALVAHSYGYAVQQGRVSYPGSSTPIRIAIRLERKGRGEAVELKLGAKDGGTAEKAADVMLYELDPSTELRILRRCMILEVCSLPSCAFLTPRHTFLTPHARF